MRNQRRRSVSQYTDSTTPLFSKSKISSLCNSYLDVQGLLAIITCKLRLSLAQRPLQAYKITLSNIRSVLHLPANHVQKSFEYHSYMACPKSPVTNTFYSKHIKGTNQSYSRRIVQTGTNFTEQHGTHFNCLTAAVPWLP